MLHCAYAQFWVNRRMKNKSVQLSVIVPVYNEAATIGQVLAKLIHQSEVKQIVVVNDGSTDQTKQKVEAFIKSLSQVQRQQIEFFTKRNGGKGTAIRFGLTKVKHPFVLIQDADLEYDPEDIPAMLDPIQKGRVEIVYGSRFIGPHLNLLFWHRLGNSFLNFLVNILYNTTLSDMETCYKLIPTQLLRSLDLKSQSFEIEPEITCKLLKRGHKIFEVPISYVGRDFSQGKKITWKDGFGAVRVILAERLR